MKIRSNCEVEREIVTQGFKDMLYIVKQSEARSEENVKAKLYDIMNLSISNEERISLKRPYEEVLSELEEQNIRIRRILLIGVYSFWELSLRGIMKYYKQFSTDSDNPLEFLKKMYNNVLPDEVTVINCGIRELRNYMTHGSSSENRDSVICNLISQHPEFFISKIDNGYIITSYKGIDSMLNTIIMTLNKIELKLKG